MSDLNFQLILDKLTAAVIAVTPRTVPTIPFKPNTSARALEELEENAIRVFEWRDNRLTTNNDEGTPHADGDSTWYTIELELAILYPTAFIVPGDSATTPRGLAGMRTADAIDINKALMFDNPLAAATLTGDYMLLQLIESSRAGRIRSMFYRIAWQELL